MLAGDHFPKTLFVLPAQLIHPLRCSVFQFGMIFIFPRTRGGFNSLELTEPHELFFSGLGQEFAAPSFAYDDVNSSHQLLRNYYVSAFSVHGSSYSVILKSHSKFNK